MQKTKQILNLNYKINKFVKEQRKTGLDVDEKEGEIIINKRLVPQNEKRTNKVKEVEEVKEVKPEVKH